MKRISGEKRSGIDGIVIAVTVILLLFGLVSLLNVISDPLDGTDTTLSEMLERLNFDFFSRQVGNIAVSLLAAVPIALIDYRKYKPFLLPAYLICCLLLLLLLLFGDTTRGIQGWFNVGSGAFSRAFQPSEISKVVLILVLSRLSADAYDKNGSFKRLRDVLPVTAVFALPFILVLLQPDFGTAMVMLMIFVAIVFAARVSWAYIIGAGCVSVVSLPLIYRFLLSGDQKKRIRVFLDPTLDPLGDGYNVLRAKELIGSGGFWGKGYFSPDTLSRTGYVPERQTDFIFSSVAEGVGFFGSCILVLLYAVLLFRFMQTAYRAKDTYGRCLCVGCSAMLFTHVFENIGMNIGLMPVTGIPLPLISYGGSNMLATLVSFAIVLSVHYRTVNRGQIQ